MSNQDPTHADPAPQGFVDLLARLLSDPKTQARFESEPETTIAEYRLSPTEKQAILSIDQRLLHQQSKTLLEKRWHEIHKLIPLTIQNSDNDLREAFDFFATQFWPSDYRRHLVDAYQFIQFLEKNEIALPDKSEKSSLKRALK